MKESTFKNPSWIVVGATLGNVVGNMPVTMFTFGVFLKPVTSEFGWSRATFSAAISASLVVGAVSMPFIGKLVDRHGIRRVTLAFVVLFSLATALLSQTRSLNSFLLLYGISGLAGAGRGPIAYAKAISGSFEARRGLALGITATGLGVGGAIVPHLTQLLIGDFGWRGAYVGLGLITFLISFPTIFLFIREPRKGISSGIPFFPVQRPRLEAENPPTDKPTMKCLRFWLLAVAVFLVSASLNGTLGHIVPLLTERGISIGFVTWLLSLSGVAMIGGQILIGYLLDRFFVAYVAGSLFLLALAGIILLSVGSARFVLIAGALCLGLGLGSESNMVAFAVSRYFGLIKFGEIFGYIMTASVLGYAVGPWVMGLNYDVQHSYRLALTGLDFALLIAALLIFRLGPYQYPGVKPSTTLDTSDFAPLASRSHGPRLI